MLEPTRDETAPGAHQIEHPLIDASSVQAWLPIESAIEPPVYPLVLNSDVQRYLDRFTGERRDLIGLWLNRAGQYLGMIREILKSRGMPEDLAFTAMIESGFNPMAVSRAGAVGLWQFMAATGRRYGLRVDHWVDERRDPEKSTMAAAAYLGDLYKLFGSWWLAQAAYNAGEMNVLKAIRATGSNDFWVLSQSRFLHQETKEFVPQIQAAAMIGRDPSQYGFAEADTTMTAFETVTVPAATDLNWLARTAGVSADMLRSLNPTLIRGKTPPGQPYALRVPLGTGSGVLVALEKPRREPPVARERVARASTKPTRRGPGVVRAASSTSEVHVVRPRDTVTSIAKHYGVSVDDVLRWNSLHKQSRIRPGDRLKVLDTRLPAERQAGVR
ncbi:MAG: transglycosylase SLT domain-containing protein [Candidatus Rokubacteria bacterium]|nr:transglycosylase SLT domain-containing protein [Candidatus Rokubacteria bacterium]